MNIVLAANGHVGSAVAKELLRLKEPVTVVLHNDKDEPNWKQLGAEVAIVDINDTAVLKQIFEKGEKAFILNPPAAPSSDTVSTEKASVASILSALRNCGLKKIVVESTYGAQPGDGIGDLGVLYDLEQGLLKLEIPAIIIRAAYYMSNWNMSLKTAKEEGIVHTLYPVDFKLPMVSPDDIGKFGAQFLMEPIENIGLRYVEGPQQYSATDVANAFSTALNKKVIAVATPKQQWSKALQEMGFSDTAAKSMVAMTNLTLENKFEQSNTAYKGETTLQQYIFQICRQK